MNRKILIIALTLIISLQAWADAAMPLNFTAVNGSATVSLNENGEPTEIALQYSRDNCVTWNTYTLGDNVTLASGEKVYFKAQTTNQVFSSSGGYYNFVMTGTVSADGSVMSLLDGTMNQTTVPDYAFHNLFENCTSLVQAPSLPGTYLASYCYKEMFKNCASLRETPELSVTDVSEGCYQGMFSGCTSLLQAPELSATFLEYACYKNMFSGCTSLTLIQPLSVEFLADYCCAYMYSGCTSLVVNTQGPGVPWSLSAGFPFFDESAVEGMFNGTAGSMNGSPSGGTVYYIVTPLRKVTVDPNNPMMGSITGGGTYNVGDTITLTATPSAGHHFVSWSNGSKKSTLTIVLAQDTTLIATFEVNNTTPLNFTAVNGPATIALAAVGTPSSVNLQYSVDGCATWNTYTIGNSIALANGAKVYFKALNTNHSFNSNSDYLHFSMTGTVSAAGNIMSLLDATMSQTSLIPYAFYHLFENCTSLVQAPELPATTLAVHCYTNMFKECTSLMQAPALPADSLAAYCYNGMFEGCTSLTHIHPLSISSLAESCCASMYSGCTSLTVNTQSPGVQWSIPSNVQNHTASSLQNMFTNTAGSMNGTPSPGSVYYVASMVHQVTVNSSDMNKGSVTGEGTYCLGEMVTLSATSTAGNHFVSWSNGSITPTITFVLTRDTTFTATFEANNTTPINFTAVDGPASVALVPVGTPSVNLQYSVDNCANWNTYTLGDTISLADGAKVYFKALTTNSVLYEGHYKNCHFTMSGKVSADGNIMSLLDVTMNQTTVPNECFRLLFDNCTSLVKAPELPATQLSDGCYIRMFNSCSSLTEAPALPAYTLAYDCYGNMFDGCTSLTKAPALQATSLANYCYLGMFYDCSSLTEAPELPATTLSEGCYEYMFNGCTSLVEAPELPATVLTNKCYDGMFIRCASLTKTPALPATTLATSCYEDMFSACTSLREIQPLSVNYLAPSSCLGMYSGCTSLIVNIEGPGIPWLIPAGVKNLKPSSIESMFGDTRGTMNETPTPGIVYYNLFGSRQLTVTANDTTMGSVTGGGTYNAGDTITLTATPAANHYFVAWSNNATTPTISFVLTQDTLFTATFAIDQHTVTVNLNDSTMGSVTGSGTYNYGDTVTLTATPAANHHFVSWSNNATTPTISFVLTQDTTFTATFAIDQHTVTVNSNDPAMGSVTGSGTYNYGDTVTLTATPAANHHFVSWSNNATTPTISFVLTQDTLFTATFAIDQHTVTVNLNDSTMGSVTGSGTYNYGDTVTLTATPNANYHFVAWSNNETTPTISFVLTQDTLFIATFAIDQHTVTVNSNDPAMGSVTGSGTYNYGDTVTLTATPNANHHFVSWSNNATTPTISFVLTQDTTFTATFAIDQHTVTVNSNDPAMGSVTGGGTYNYGDTVTLTATPNANHHFVSWSNNSTTPTISFVITQDTLFIATFAIDQHTVTVNSNDPAMGSVTGDGTYNYGDTVTLTATPAANHHFVSWSNNATTPTISFVLTQDTLLTATFAIDQHTVTVNSNDPAMGSVTGSGTYNYGDTVTLTATPNANHHFVSWSNNSTTPTISFAITQDTLFIATFAIDQHTVTVNSNDPAMGSVTGSGTYNYGDTVTLTATPAANHHFVSWSNNATTPTISFVITQDTLFTATFAIDQHTVTVNSNDPAMGSVTGDGTYNYGDTVTLTATPNANHHFVSWSNNAITPTISFVITQDTLFIATFAIDQHTVTVNSNDPAMGSVTGDGTYNYGDNVTLTATPATGHHFVSWNNGSTSPTLVFAITQDTSFTATFALSQYTVTVNTNDPAMGSVTSGGTYNYGDTITLTATPAANHHFVSWSNGAKTSTITFALTQDTTLTATFEADAFNGIVSDNLYWSIDRKSGELSFTGSGSTPDYSLTSHAPWYYNRSYVSHVSMPAGVVSRLGDYAFDNFTNLTYAELNTDTLGASLFNGCSSLTLCYSETNAVANSQTMDGCNANPVLIAHDYEWYKHTYTDSLGLSLNIYPYSTDYTQDSVLTMNATVTLLPSYRGISVVATRHLVNGAPLHLTDDCNIVWKDNLVAPLVYEFLSQGVGYLGKNSFLGCTSLHRIIVSPKYWGTNGTTSDYAYAHLDSIHADAFDSIYPDIVDLYEETLYQPGKVENYTSQKNNLGQTLLYVPDTLAATGKTMLAQYTATPFWYDNFADINNKNIVDTQYVDTASAHVSFYYQDVIDSVPVESYHLVLYKIGGTDTANVYFSNDTTFEINRKPRIILIVDSVSGTTTTVTLSIDHSAYNPGVQEVNVAMENLSPNSTYSITISALDKLGQELATDNCSLNTNTPLSDPTVTEDRDDEIFFPTEETDVYHIDGHYIGKYTSSLPAGIYLMRDNNRWYKFAKSR